MTNDLDEERLGQAPLTGPDLSTAGVDTNLSEDCASNGPDGTRLSGPLLDAQSLSKSLAIKLAVRELERLPERCRYFFHGDKTPQPVNMELADKEARKIIENLLIGLGCEEVVEAWRKV